MKKSVVLILFSFLLVGCANQQDSDNIEVISAEEMQELLQLDSVQLIDIRTPREYKDAFIIGSQNLDYMSDTFGEDVERLDKSKPVILYCKSGYRSARCAKQLREKGFVKIYDLEGGITKWKYAGFDLESTP